MTTDTRSGAGTGDGGSGDRHAAGAPGPAAHLAAFHALHHAPGHPLLLPNAWDSASALALADAGHPAIGTTSLGVAGGAGPTARAGGGPAPGAPRGPGRRRRGPRARARP
ncbi:isocitrate lyase/phosphoenolpyruvate mutase family protein, partial [Streptomyces sp. NPDC059152]|uniref:isocitrate lyase/phosphoenolpyruvate mutase family protein n=1 Tax=Streptomyces sp. NPDC059152 TaxID=3346742 RepID=UPI00369E9514